MQKIILWEKEIEKELRQAEEGQLDDFLDLVRFFQVNDIRCEICESTLDRPELWEWLYSKEPIELNDIKRELARRLEKTRCRAEKEFDELLLTTGKRSAVKVLILSMGRKSVYYISTIPQYYEGLRKYLLMEKKDEFCSDLPECFPNIFFADGIDTTINTLNRKFEEIQEEIVDHLTHINDYHANFYRMLKENRSFQEIAQQFAMDTGIECSPQAGRDKVKILKESQRNEITGEMETVVCELHTKFKIFNTDRNHRDRIYFYPGKPGIRGGRIIVKYIGTHV